MARVVGRIRFVGQLATLSVGLGLVVLVALAFDSTASESAEPSSLFDVLDCDPDEQFVGSSGFWRVDKFSGPAEAIDDYWRVEWPQADTSFKATAVKDLPEVAVGLSEDGRASVLAVRADDGWVVQAALACESFVRTAITDTPS